MFAFSLTYGLSLISTYLPSNIQVLDYPLIGPILANFALPSSYVLLAQVGLQVYYISMRAKYMVGNSHRLQLTRAYGDLTS